MKSVKLFIVDDHYMIIEGIVSLMKNETAINIIGHAQNAQSCMTFLQRMLPDVIFLDINLPDKSGIDICKEIKTLYPTIKVIALSTFNQNSYILKMLDNGASGYLLKNATKEEMLEAIQTVIQHKQYLAKEAAESIKENGTNKPILTRREKEILQLLAQGLTSNDIGKQLFISPTTVDTHRKHLLEKFKVNNSAILIKQATEFGLI
ncbi:MAG: response regulator transcription factor [Chitinophagales bacterium]|jgi:DNA-binding NarL/FixJ family response regulator|nr:response regulator transcription factor [Chitinophagales bacterium]